MGFARALHGLANCGEDEAPRVQSRKTPPKDRRHCCRGRAALSLITNSLTGQTFQRYQCLEHSVPADALAVHGLSAEFLVDKPLFAAIADEFLTFVGDAPLVAHNAGFDIAFLNAELNCAAKAPIAAKRVIDMLVLARRASIPANTTRSTTYAHAMALIAPAAHNTASMPSCWPRFVSS